MKENKKQSNQSKTENSKETTKNIEPETGLSDFLFKPGVKISLKAKELFTDEIIRKVFIKNAHHKDGGALGILLPKEVKTKMGLKRGDYVFIKASNDMIIIRKCVTNGAES